MRNRILTLRARLTAGVPKWKQPPRTLMGAFSDFANEGATSPVRVIARRKDRNEI